MLDLDWIDGHHDEFDVMHLHFGFDAATPAHLLDWTRRLEHHRIPLVMTVHDLVNPHFADPAGHLAQLDVLIPAAAAVVTLTQQAAAIISRRWGATATVIPHPHVVPSARIARTHPEHDRFIVGIHAKSLRANIDPLPLLTELLPALPTMPAVRLRVDVHTEILEHASPDERVRGLRDWVVEATDHPQVQIAVHARFDDEQLWDYLQAIDLCILPYRFGTHSGWLEACVDLGTAVLVPTTGCYSGQHGHPTYGPGAAGMVDMVRAIAAQPGVATPPARIGARNVSRSRARMRRSTSGYCNLVPALSSVLEVNSVENSEVPSV